MQPSPFLSRVGERERSPLRWAVWLGLSGLLFTAGAIPVGLLLGTLDLQTVIQQANKGPLPDEPRRLIGEVQFTFVITATLALLTVAVLTAARLAFNRPAWTFVTPAAPFRQRLLWAGFLLFGAIAVVGLMLERALRGEPLAPPVLDPDYPLDTRLIYAALSALFLLLAAAAEELMFRGVLLQLVGGVVRSLPVLILVNGLLFSAFHLDPSPGAFAARAISGAVWTWTALRLAGLEFAIGAHWANNLVLCLLLEPISSGAQPGRDYPAASLFADVIATAVLVGCVLLALRSPGLRAWAQVDPPRPVETAFD